MLLGLLPLVACVCWSCAHGLPQYRNWRKNVWEDRLSNLTGFRVQIGTVVERRPNHVSFHDLQIVRHEDGVTIAQAQDAELLLGNFSQFNLIVTGLEVELTKLGTQMHLVHERLLCRPTQSRTILNIRANDSTLHAAGEKFEVTNALAKLETSKDETHFRMQFQLPSTEARSELHLKRIHTPSSQATFGSLAAATPLRISLVQHVWHFAERFGSEATLLGKLHWSCDETNWVVSVTQPKETESQKVGLLLEDVDFENLTWNDPAEITGKGSIWIQQAEFNSRRLGSAQGGIWVANGRICKPLLLEAKSRLGVRLAGSLVQSTIQDIPFKSLAVGFEISPPLLNVAGLLGNGVMMVDGTDAEPISLVAQPETSGAPLLAIIPILDSRRQDQELPQGRLAREVLHYLPIDDRQQNANRDLQVTNR